MSGQQRNSSLVTFLRILDLFDMDDCYINLSHDPDEPPAPFLEGAELAECRDLPCRIRCRSLSVNQRPPTTSMYSPVLATLSSYLEPGTLRMFTSSAVSAGDFEAIGKVLFGPGREITRLQLVLMRATHTVLSSIDEALCPPAGEPARHPNLRLFTPHFNWRPVGQSTLVFPDCREAVEETFRGLHQRGVMQYTSVDQENEYHYD
ncbi:hypothetical protein C8Q80DRAFT_1124424 [Daedaleopsis nitida]|nr:hypothetical protein C8Q80DRAFT_1124424 [Daedaleopsis nitida]